MGEKIEKGIWKGWTQVIKEDKVCYEKDLDKDCKIRMSNGFFWLEDEMSLTGPFVVLKDAIDYRPKMKDYNRTRR